MIRNLKVLGLTLAAILTMGAASASAASAANGMLTSDGPFTLSGTEEAGVLNGFTAFALTTKCAGTTYLGEAVGGGNIASGAEAFTLTPTFPKTCSLGSLPMTVTPNGCHFVVNLGETTAVKDQYSVTIDLVCPPDKDFVFDVYAGAAQHSAGQIFCTITIQPQGGWPGATLTDETNGHLTLGGTAENILIEKSGGCNQATEKNAKWDLGLTFSGKDAKGGATAVSITHK
jgi:hypothetical protein